MERHADLGDFLRSRRARLQPEDVGLVAYGARRRVPGLRREELAQLAGVSIQYYTRLEQGQSKNASDAVLDALADALRLSDNERGHLRELARPSRPAPRRPPPERLGPGLRQLLDAMPDVPAIVLGRRNDILAWNRLGHALLAGHEPYSAPEKASGRPNLATMVFLDPHMRELFADWRHKAQEIVSHLRVTAARHPDDARLTALIGELIVKSPDFAALWSAYQVSVCGHATRDYRHPLVGTLTLTQQPLQLPDHPEHRVVTYTAEHGSPSEAALRLLATATAGGVPAPERGRHPCDS
ncbi:MULTISPECIES: helix-turn-helix domain-containing protein [Actinomadura]|uniref:Helix-turn-helix domain-containing protein n=1 Tax=Actinomadura yumaensis TaxID=111807 RepID=A0ABW2CQN7_9ACTN|nr:helix-turn-helix transcriptional regulator [Actinomadura sp. J1-007]MWK37512.1 helix-turn-helix domain-containing protein [Actinomadura sp. J1-007]